MRQVLFAALVPAAMMVFSASSFANDTFDAMLDNTVHVVDDTGAESNWMFKSDGTVSNSHGETGTWEINGDHLCSVMTGHDEPICVDVPPGKGVGDTWEQIGGDGTPITVTIIAG